MSAATGGAATPRRARWPWVVLIIVVLIAVLVVAAEVIARAVVPSVVRGLVVDELDLPADQQLDVETSGILLPQLIAGSLDELRLSSDEITIGGITGAAEVIATGVPLGAGELGSAEGTVSIDQSQFAALLAASDLPISEISVEEPDITVHGGIPVLGREIPLSLTLTPGADGGDLMLTPVSAAVAGNEIDLQRLAAIFGDAGAALADTHRVCIADQLPAGITLTGLRIDGTAVVADISADGRIGVDETLLEPGTCPR
ncbi:LmeA family phospholipid-binding protein [Microbacterium alcoholitolerans]|uniref:LmeA family phospholipid-binding protein n=1 Tax=unclassified Microbacterium TaxID=2609290 RepID=UPI003D168F28